MESDRSIAVLIDADNVSPKYIRAILDEVANHGLPTYKRIYGDWTSSNMTSWKGVLLENSITPIQQYSYTVGKNATDSALIIDAMDILYSGNVDGFCIVSSDSDFTRLATRLREAGMMVLGMGERKTPKPFIAACEVFRYLENLLATTAPQPQKPEKAAGSAGAAKKKTGAAEPAEQKEPEFASLIAAITAIVGDISNEDGWAGLGAVGSNLSKRQPDFDTRSYGYTKLLPLVTATKAFVIQKKITTDIHGTQYYIKVK